MDEKLRVVIEAEVNSYIKSMQKAKGETEDFSDDSEKALAEVDKAIDETKKIAKTSMLAFGAALAAGAASIVGLAESTREYRTEQAKLSTSFENTGKSAESAYSTYEELMSIIGETDQCVEASQQISLLADSEADCAKWAELAAGVYSKFGDALQPETFYEAANETISLGEATGAYTQMLEQAGYNVEDFNKGLAECKTKADKQAYALKTANKILGSASKEYKQNNKDLIAANKATEEWNNSLSKVGGHLEPAITDLKEMGAALLEDAEEPLKAIAETVTDDIIPAVQSGIKWAKENKEVIVGTMAAATVAVVGYKASVLATELAEKGLTAAKIAGAAAQKTLNAVMAANPYGLVLTALSALTVGLIAWYESAENVEPIQVLTEEELELRDAAIAAKDAFKQQQDAFVESAGKIQAESDYMTELADELQTLADNSGKVKEADEARVNFILKELNDAYGTEYELVNGVISQYDSLKTKIYEVIQAKTANALLEAYNAAYVEALNAESKALADVVLAEKEYTAQIAVVDKKEAEYTKAKAKYLEMQKNARTNQEINEANAYALTIERLRIGLDTEKETLSKKEKAYNDNALAYAETQETIRKYTEASEAVMQGNYETAIEILKAKSNGYFKYAGEVDEATRLATDALFEEAVKAGLAASETKTKFENGVDGYTKEMVEESEKAYEDALAAWADAYNGAHKVGADLGGGLKAGMENTVPSLVTKAKSIISRIWGAMRKEADSHSPSKKAMRLGSDMDEGLAIGFDKNADKPIKAAKNLVQESLKPIETSIEGVSANNFNSLLNSGSIFGGLQSAIKSVKSLEFIGSNTPNSSGNAPTKVILTLDKKVLAEGTVEGINDLTRLTGNLPLVLA